MDQEGHDRLVLLLYFINLGASLAAGARGQVVEWVGLGDRASMEYDLVAVVVDIVDAYPRGLHLDAHSIQLADRPGLDMPGEVAPELELVVVDADDTVPGEGHLEGAVWVKGVGLHALWEDAPGEAVLLQHLVRADGSGGGHGGGEEDGCHKEGEMVLGHGWSVAVLGIAQGSPIPTLIYIGRPAEFRSIQ